MKDLSGFARFALDLETSMRESYYEDPVELTFKYDGNSPWGDLDLHLSDTKYGLTTSKSWEAACQYQLALRLSGAAKNSGKDTLNRRRLFEQGYMCEDLWLARCKPRMEAKGWDVVGRYDRGPGEFEELTGSPDWIFCKDECVVIVDAKTRRSAWYRYQGKALPADSDGFILNFEAKDTERLQVQSYLKQEDGSFGAIFAGDRDGGQRWALSPVWRDDAAVEAAVAIIRRIKDTDPELVPKIAKAKGKIPWQCQWCDYYESTCGGAV